MAISAHSVNSGSNLKETNNIYNNKSLHFCFSTVIIYD